MKQEQDTLKQRIRSGKIRPADVTRTMQCWSRTTE